MLTKRTNKYKHIRVSYIINIVCLLHASATLFGNTSAVNCKRHITKVFEPMLKRKILRMKIDDLYLCLYFNT